MEYLLTIYFGKLPEHILQTTSDILINNISDQQSYIPLIGNVISNTPTLTFVTIIKQDAKSQNKFQEQLEESEKINSPVINLNIDANIKYNILHNLIQTSKELHLPSKLVRFNKYKHTKANGFLMALHYKLHSI